MEKKEKPEEDGGGAKSRSWFQYVPRPLRSGYRRVVPRPLRVFLRTRTRVEWIAFALYVILQLFFNRIHFGLPFFGVAIIAFIFLNLSYGQSSRQPGQLSAYSVFNRGQQRLPGTLDANEYDRMLRRGGM